VNRSDHIPIVRDFAGIGANQSQIGCLLFEPPSDPCSSPAHAVSSFLTGAIFFRDSRGKALVGHHPRQPDSCAETPQWSLKASGSHAGNISFRKTIMSVQTARRFLEFVTTNPGVQTQLRVSDPRTLDKLLTFAHGKGYIISAEELEAALKEFPPSPLVDFIRARARVRP
jgi:hypothetical protein